MLFCQFCQEEDDFGACLRRLTSHEKGRDKRETIHLKELLLYLRERFHKRRESFHQFLAHQLILLVLDKEEQSGKSALLIEGSLNRANSVGSHTDNMSRPRPHL